MNKIKWSDLSHNPGINVPKEAFRYNGSTDECCERYWDSLSPEQQLEEINKSLELYMSIVIGIQNDMSNIINAKY